MTRAGIERWNLTPVPARVAERAHSRFTVDGECWISTYSVSTHGYAQIGWSGGDGRNHMVLAHRASWVHVNGQVPIATTLDHMCKNRRCVNPDHLRLLSNVENARRNQGDDFPMGECRHGHPTSEMIPITRRKKDGQPRTGLTCGRCMKDSRARYLDRKAIA